MNALDRAKYRGKRVDNGEWAIGILVNSHVGPMILTDNEICDLVSFISGTGFSCIGLEVIPKTVGQFTGLQDKNGVDVYEGDMLDFLPKEWGDNSLCENPEAIALTPVGEWSYCGSLSDVSEWRAVVGNLHDNPELLEPSK